MLKIAIAFVATALLSSISPVFAADYSQDELQVVLSTRMSPYESEIARRLQPEIRKIYLARKLILPTLRDPELPIKTAKILSDNILAIDFDVSLDRSVSVAEMDGFTRALENSIENEFRSQAIGSGGIVFFFSGKPPSQVYSSIAPDNTSIGSTAPKRSTGPVVVSAAHGLFYHHGNKRWEFQRSFMNGLREDTHTPKLTRILSSYLQNRSKVDVKHVRSFSSEANAASNRPWSQMSARYFVENLLPNRPNIWASYSKKHPNEAKREESDDINVRPLYANYLQASGLISIHTNGNDTPVAGPFVKGFRVVRHIERPSDAILANNIRCYMEELRSTSKKYEKYKLLDVRASNGYGEINLAKMPTVIVEPGYHSNKSDAKALKDPVFMRIAMKSVEKGWRLTQEGMPCEHFSIESIPNTVGNHNEPIPIAVNFTGYPQFAVNISVKVVSCPSDWTCSDGNITITEKTPSPVSFTLRCRAANSKPTATFGIEVSLTDIDKVMTKPMQSKVTCNPTEQNAEIESVRTKEDVFNSSAAALYIIR